MTRGRIITAGAIVAALIVGVAIGQGEPPAPTEVAAAATATPAPTVEPTPAPTEAPTPTPTPTPEPTPTPTPEPRETVELEGKTDGSSKQFYLEGDYRVTWKARPSSEWGCFFGQLLIPDGIGTFEDLGDVTTDDDGRVEGETFIYGAEGLYHIDTFSTCGKWRTTFEPIEGEGAVGAAA